ncbi:MAG: 2-oxoacid:ferredoxin oxidoreductase subunit beta [Patescibacteria group bacterium]
MLTEKDFLTPNRPTWCPGCGNYAIWLALRQALAELNLAPHNVLLVFGIGCSGNGYNFTKAYAWHSLHGRSVPTAVGAKLANKDLTVIALAGDGDGYGEGLNHLLQAIRGNVDITYIVHDNKVYGLTTGQASPTSDQGFETKSSPQGTTDEALNPIALSLAGGASFVARGFSGQAQHLKELFKAAITHKGFSLVDVFQPCVTFNKVNTFKWFFDRLYNLDTQAAYDKKNLGSALEQSLIWGDKIPYGIFYQKDKRELTASLPVLSGAALAKRPMNIRNLDKWLAEFS